MGDHKGLITWLREGNNDEPAEVIEAQDDEIERLRGELIEARALKVPPTVDELLQARMDKAVAETVVADLQQRIVDLEREREDWRRTDAHRERGWKATEQRIADLTGLLRACEPAVREMADGERRLDCRTEWRDRYKCLTTALNAQP